MAPLGLRRVSRNAFNAQLTRGTSKLGFSFCIGILGIDVEDAVPINIERRWHAVRPHLAQRGLGLVKTQKSGHFYLAWTQSFYEASIYTAAIQRCTKNTLEYAF